MNRIDERMQLLKEKNEKAFITYTTVDLPDYETTKKIMHAQEEAGIDLMEIGVPFSDPVADGPVVQAASYKAILNGATLEGAFKMMKEVREEGLTSPVAFMMYYNTVYHYGLEAFADKCVECGVDGLVIPDLPYEEQEELKTILEARGDKVYLIQLVSPVSADRIPMLLKDAKGFVYCVSHMGVTGGDANFHENIKAYLKSVHDISPVPACMGFGIRTADDVKPLMDVVDGAVVGSHFLKLLEESNYSTDAVIKYIKEFKEGLRH